MNTLKSSTRDISGRTLNVKLKQMRLLLSDRTIYLQMNGYSVESLKHTLAMMDETE